MKLPLILVLSLLAESAVAQTGDSDVDPLAAQAIRNFGICAATRTPSGAEALLEMDYRTQEHRDATRTYAVGHAECAPGAELRFSGLPFVGALAEAFVRRLPPGEFSRRVAYDPARPALTARDETEMMALCTVRRDPTRAQALLAAEPGTAAERVASRALTPSIRACLGAGQSMRLNRMALRSLVAIAAYRLMRHNDAAVVAATGN
jgi:hypothetical protein